MRLSGEITAHNAARIGDDLRNALRSHPRVVEIDLQRVPYLGSGGGRALLTVLRAARVGGTRMIVTHAGAQARGTLDRLGLVGVLDVCEGAAPEG